MPDSDIKQFEDNLMDFFVQAADLLGIPRSPAMIYGAIFASPVPLCFADIETKLELSKGTISQGLNLLKEIGAIKTVDSPQYSRREYYVPDLEMRRLIQRFLETKVQPQINQGSQRLATLRKTLETTNSRLPDNGLETLKDRLSQLENWHSKTKTLLPVVYTIFKIRPLLSKNK